MKLFPDFHRLKIPQPNFGIHEEEIKNRLIIVGNGFDIAHGLNTRFSDFIKSYLSESINIFYRKLHFNDDLLTIKLHRRFTSFKPTPKRATIDNVMDKLDELISHGYVIVDFKSQFFELCVKSTIDLNWVNIESLYFECLLEVNSTKNPQIRANDIKYLNKDLDKIRERIILFLKRENENFENKFDKSHLVDCFCEEIVSKEVVTISMSQNMVPENLYFLNFNYTNTLEDYVSECNKTINSDLNYIHGNLEGEKGEPIIGFGDEFNKKYLEFEDQQNNDLFQHIKSFAYLRTDNYYNLLRFIDSELFQVHIYGHSCGITDRTMLNHIFEHVNCKSIKIFYHQREDGSDDFTDKTFEISRHFKIKGDMREKVVPLPFSKPMPQPAFI